MTSPVLLCTDGSELANAALAAGVALLGADNDLVVVSVADEPDPGMLTGSGHAGSVITPEEFDRKTASAVAEAEAVVVAAQQVLGLEGGESRILGGDPGGAICRLAEDLSAAAVVMGSRGRGGLKRAVLGSVSDYVVRNAPCTVIVTGNQD